MLEAYLEILDMGYYEATFVFDGLANEHVWKRPDGGLLSIGEVAGHVAYWEAIKLASDGSPEARQDLTKCRVVSPLIDQRFRYYSSSLAVELSEEQLAMSAEQVCSELLRVHKESVTCFKQLNPDLNVTPDGWSPPWTYGEFLRYAAFHVAYHTGQMYSARHLLGEVTPDN